MLALQLVAGVTPCDGAWTRTQAVLGWINTKLRPVIDACGAAEISAFLRGLDGRFVRPGPSGAPTRGRPDVLPTGRNFFAVDVRAVPTPSAWRIGQLAAERLVEALLAGSRRVAARDRAVGLGHRQHAHRRRRRRAGVGADRRAPVVGGDLGAGHRLCDHTPERTETTAGRCHLSRLRTVPRCLSDPDGHHRQRHQRHRHAR